MPFAGPSSGAHGSHNETDPLLLSGPTRQLHLHQHAYYDNTKRNSKFSSRCLLISVILVCSFIAIIIAFTTGIRKRNTTMRQLHSKKFYHDFVTTTLLPEIQKNDKLVYYDPKQDLYHVSYDVDFNVSTSSTSSGSNSSSGQKINKYTFAQLGQLMIQPWYDASIIAIHNGLQLQHEHQLEPNKVKQIRKTLLTTRDLLDVFSPLYKTHSLWSTIRQYYKIGYEVIGEYQDLDHSGVKYTKQDTIYQQRKQIVIDWFNDYIIFLYQHYHTPNNNIRTFLSSTGIQTKGKGGCYNHKESHLFWNEQIQQLPCGNDDATTSLNRLGIVQLQNHAMQYWITIQNYTSVLDIQHQEEYHNLRKEIRSFLDEYELFYFIMFPTTYTTKKVHDSITILQKTFHKLGKINDDWVAYDIYTTKLKKKQKKQHHDKNSIKSSSSSSSSSSTTGSSSSNQQQQELEDRINKLKDKINTKWYKFKRWASGTNNDNDVDVDVDDADADHGRKRKGNKDSDHGEKENNIGLVTAIQTLSNTMKQEMNIMT